MNSLIALAGLGIAGAAGFILFQATLESRRVASLATGLLVLLAALALLVVDARAALALGLLLAALCGAWDGRGPARAGAPAAAIAAAWAHFGIGFIALSTLILLYAGTLPPRERLRSDGLPHFAGLAAAALGLVLLPQELFPVPRLLRLALLLAAALLSLVAAQALATLTLHAKGRRAAVAATAALPALAFLGLVALQARHPLLPPASLAPAVAAALAALAAALALAALLLGLVVVLGTANHAKGWMLALMAGLPAAWLAGGNVALLAALPIIAASGAVALLLIARRPRETRGLATPLRGEGRV